MTYSFPCQDLSLAGKGKGMADTSTRSGMLWEVERILSECEELPQILLMENVPQVHSLENMKDFHKWQVRLEELGYKNYWQDLIATDYGIPQTRNRCFMVSILGDYSYTFPPKQKLKLKLKDTTLSNELIGNDLSSYSDRISTHKVTLQAMKESIPNYQEEFKRLSQLHQNYITISSRLCEFLIDIHNNVSIIWFRCYSHDREFNFARRRAD